VKQRDMHSLSSNLRMPLLKQSQKSISALVREKEIETSRKNEEAEDRLTVDFSLVCVAVSGCKVRKLEQRGTPEQSRQRCEICVVLQVSSLMRYLLVAFVLRFEWSVLFLPSVSFLNAD
jgi:hypothetical protein